MALPKADARRGAYVRELGRVDINIRQHPGDLAAASGPIDVLQYNIVKWTGYSAAE